MWETVSRIVCLSQAMSLSLAYLHHLIHFGHGRFTNFTVTRGHPYKYLSTDLVVLPNRLFYKLRHSLPCDMEADWILAMASVMVLYNYLQFSFNYHQCSFGQVSATAVSGLWFWHANVGRQPYRLGRCWSGSGFVTWPLSHHPSASGHTLNMLQLISVSYLNRPCRCCTVVIIYLLQVVGIYVDRSITSS